MEINTLINTNDDYNKNHQKLLKCQSIIRGHLCRIKRLPNFLYTIQIFLKNHNIKICNDNNDGRINSCIDEDEVINLLLGRFETRIKKGKVRMWYDILIYDYHYGWLPVNIKSTTTLTTDNTGNLAMCVHSYTNEKLDLEKDPNNMGKEIKALLGHMNREKEKSE